MDVSLVDRQALVLAAEETLADRLAQAVLPRPKPSVWMILLPPLFVFFALDMQRHKKEAKIFADGFLFTKRLALKLAGEAAAQGGAAPAVVFPDPPSEIGTPAAWERIRAAQAKEVALLQEHYGRLLAAQGATYAGLVQGAYGTPGEYLAFCNALRQAEAAVNACMLEEIHTTAAAKEATAAMENALEELRLEQMRRIFGMR
ncbi:MAG: hypothetical protein H5U09_05045 [Desulfomicrobiaceae bacterium]|nr:hypothetical protein [Desulfomicrobiaceae bacterium]